MLIHGLQKMTLLDFPGHVACTVFLGGCDFRCPYCHNFELVDGSASPIMDEEEFFAFMAKRHGLLDGVAITGGEPLLRPEIINFIQKIQDIGFLVKLDTNGYHPDLLKEITDRGLVSYIAMDIKNSPSKYGLTTGIKNLDITPIKKSIETLMNSDIDYEFRTTVVKEYHTEADFEEIGGMIKGAKAYFLQQYTERDTVFDRSLTPPTDTEMQKYLSIAQKYVPCAQVRGV